MAEIYLVRHGQASFNSDNYDQLSKTGWLQSKYLGHYFNEREIAFDHIFTGTQKRHIQTADGIFSSPDMTIRNTQHHGLNEYDFKALYNAYMLQHPELKEAQKSDGRHIYYQRLKKALALWSNDDLNGDIPESWSDFKRRIKDALNHIRHDLKGKCLVVSSGGAIAMLIGHILDLSPQKIIDLNLQIKNSSYSHIYCGGSSIQLSTFNAIPHLDQRDRLQNITYS